MATYARPGSGVTRSWRAQPWRRSVATGTAWLMAAPIAPYAAIETRKYTGQVRPSRVAPGSPPVGTTAVYITYSRTGNTIVNRR